MPDVLPVNESMTPQGIVCTLKPTVDLKQDFFSILGLMPSCEIDLEDLSRRYRSLQQVIHPDRFLRDCDRSQRLAQQQAALVNEAYQTLKSPLPRAQYLLELAGQHCPPEATTRDTVFLVEQMELRERLDMAAGSLAELEALHNDVSSTLKNNIGLFAAAWMEKNWSQAKAAVVKLQFATKLLHEIEERQARLLDA